MHFWSGSTVRPEEITDIPSYNRANGLMGNLRGLYVCDRYIVTFSIKVGAVLLVIVCVPGIAVLIFVYNQFITSTEAHRLLIKRMIQH